MKMTKYNNNELNTMITEHINENQFIISKSDKEFIVAFTHALEEMGYIYGETIGNGFCWGKYMLIFRKANAKSKNVVARIYVRADSIVLRLFFNNVTKHSDYIDSTPENIKNVFVGKYGTCTHCKGDNCKFRKDYEISGTKFEKCNGTTFEFYNPNVERLPDYIELFREFYPVKGA